MHPQAAAPERRHVDHTKAPTEVPRLARHLWQTLDPSSCVRAVAAGRMLARQGDDVDRVWLIEEGLAKLVWRDAHGREAIFGVRLAGWPVGTIAALAGGSHGASVEAVTRCTVREVGASAFLRRLEEHPALAYVALTLTCFEVDDIQTVRSLSLAALPAADRVALLFAWLLHMQGAARTRDRRGSPYP